MDTEITKQAIKLAYTQRWASLATVRNNAPFASMTAYVTPVWGID